MFLMKGVLKVPPFLLVDVYDKIFDRKCTLDKSIKYFCCCVFYYKLYVYLESIFVLLESIKLDATQRR